VIGARLVTEWLPGAHATTAPLPLSTVSLGIGLTLLVGLGVGLFHGLLINRLRLPPFIATLATMAALRSVATLVSHNRPVNIASPTFRLLGSDNRYSIPISLAVALVMSLVMGTTLLGRHLYAIGGNEAAARLSGLRTRGLKTTAYAISGVLAALAGLLFAGNTGQADYRMGVTYELYAITAAVVGGCSLAGGVGSVRGTVLGLLLIQIVIKGTGLVVRGIDPSQIEGLVLGTVVVLAVAFNQRVRGRE
jgi:ribose/xylose/arabinose/galactoside ABC-type transport system permease subunit